MKKFRKIVKYVGFFNALKVLLGVFFINTYNRFFRPVVKEFATLSDINRHYPFNFTENGKEVQIKMGSDQVNCRRFSSDLAVFEQIFLKDELKYLLEILKMENAGSVRTIVDAGANIGLFTLRVHGQFPDAKFIVIEPDLGNFQMLQKNLLENKIGARFENTGIWTESRKLYFDRNFRDKKEWSISLTEDPISRDFVEALSLNDIVSRHSLSRIDILKIDIEGGERFIFNTEKKGLEFLAITKVLVIEIHDEFDIRESIIHLLAEAGFTTNKSGEYLLAFNSYLN